MSSRRECNLFNCSQGRKKEKYNMIGPNNMSDKIYNNTFYEFNDEQYNSLFDS